MIDKIGQALNFFLKVYFDLFFFSVYKWLVLLVFKSSILIQEFISFFFLYFFHERVERGSPNSDTKKENRHVMVLFCLKIFNIKNYHDHYCHTIK
jgi:hypothetical protein